MFWYHAQTKHSYNSVRMYPNRLSWEDQPSVYKRYPERFTRFPLRREDPEDDFLYHIAGINAKKSYPGVEYYLRMNPSAGALYPNELYMQIRGVERRQDGIYHFDVAAGALTLLYALGEREGIEPYLGMRHAIQGYLFLVSSVYWRSSWKYKRRAFRYCLLDAGHILGAIEASALLKPHATQMHYDFDKERLNAMFGFERGEWFTAAAIVATPISGQEVEPARFSLPYVDPTGSFEPEPLIEQAYTESMTLQQCRRQSRAPHFAYKAEMLKEVIFSRRSQRGFNGEAITKGQFHYLMDILAQPVLSDCEERVNVYVVVNRVIDMPLGLYRDGSYLEYGDFSQKAGYLSLEQYNLSTQGALAFFMTSDGKNYQALYQKAGIIGHRLYIAANYLGLGASGIGAYYDDEVNAFIGNDEMVLYAFAIGR
ncbi:MAG: dehydrogenase [Sulfurovum sp.]|nr:MAG: dehydrogenase [Sulfurovum sp.]